MTDDSIPRCIFIIVLIAAGGLFTGAETAFSNCNRTRIKTLADEGNAAAKRVVEILVHYDRMTVTLLTAVNITYVTAAAVSAVPAADLFGPAGAAATAIVLALFVFLSTDAIKKNAARANCDLYAMNMSLPVLLLSALFLPLSAVFIFSGELLKRLIHRGAESPKITGDEFQTIIENAGEKGILEPEEKQIICSAVEFGDLRACDVMTGREDITALDIAIPPDKIRGILCNEKYSRLPLIRGDLDHIIGVIQQRDYLSCLLDGESEPVIEKIAVQPYRIPPDIKLGLLFEGMSHRRSHLAVVTGAGGVTLGIVTMDDILEKIVGESQTGGEKTKVTGNIGTMRSDYTGLPDNKDVQTAVSV